jgi:hypothetical protein
MGRYPSRHRPYGHQADPERRPHDRRRGHPAGGGMPEGLIGVLYRHDGGRLDGGGAGTAVGQSAIRPAEHLTDPSLPQPTNETSPNRSIPIRMDL